MIIIIIFFHDHRFLRQVAVERLVLVQRLMRPRAADSPGHVRRAHLGHPQHEHAGRELPGLDETGSEESVPDHVVLRVEDRQLVAGRFCSAGCELSR